MLYHLLIHLYEEGTLEDVITALAGLGIEDAVVVDGQRLSQVLAFDVPIFAGFREEIGRRSSYCKVLSAIVDSPDVVDELVRYLKEAGVDFNQEGIGSMMAFPIERCIGKPGHLL